jgi:hypothetical protein
MDDPKTKGPHSLREPSCFSTTILAGLSSTAEVGDGRPENEGSPLPPEGEGQGEGINLRALRRQSSNAERVLWRDLRARRLLGYKFRRQVVIEPYIVDFACLEARLIIEADGGQHSDQVAYDARRTTRLEGMGYRVMPPHPVPLPGERESECTANPQIFRKSLFFLTSRRNIWL